MTTDFAAKGKAISQGLQYAYGKGAKGAAISRGLGRGYGEESSLSQSRFGENMRFIQDFPEAQYLSQEALDYIISHTPLPGSTSPEEDVIATGSWMGDVRTADLIHLLATPEAEGGLKDWFETMPEYQRRILLEKPTGTGTGAWEPRGEWSAKRWTDVEGMAEQQPVVEYPFLKMLNWPEFGGTLPTTEDRWGTPPRDYLAWGGPQGQARLRKKKEEEYRFLQEQIRPKKKEEESTGRAYWGRFAPPARWLTF